MKLLNLLTFYLLRFLSVVLDFVPLSFTPLLLSPTLPTRRSAALVRCVQSFRYGTEGLFLWVGKVHGALMETKAPAQ
jgi:hypothetical protein